MDAPQGLLVGVRRLSECRQKIKRIELKLEENIAKSDAKFNKMINLRRSRRSRLGSGAAKEK